MAIGQPAGGRAEGGRLLDLSHAIEEGMTTYKGLPGPQLCDFWSREESAANYDDGSSFHIGRIDMVANTGTYLDAPFHRYADGADLAQLDLKSLANLDGITIRRPWREGIAIDSEAFEGLDISGKAVIVATGWDEHWRSDAYFGDHPYLTAEAAQLLAERGAALVGIDSCNIDNMHVRARPVHTILLGAGIPICEHMTSLGQVPDSGFRFAAVPPKVKGLGTFPVRAYALVA